MESNRYLLLLALILISTKLCGLATEKIHLPQVVGALLAGLVLGPSGFGVLQSTDFLVKTAEIGVILLMFTAGIDTDLEELKQSGPRACVVAVLGVAAPMLLCGGVYYGFFLRGLTAGNVLKAAFVGAVFSATSVSITVETLNEMGKLKTRVGAVLLSAALIDDVIGIVVLSVLSGFSAGGESPLRVLGRIGLFFVFALAVGGVVRRLFSDLSQEHWHSRRVAVWALAFCLLMSYCAEAVFGVADITGAYFAGLILCNVAKCRQFVAKKTTVTAYMVFTPVFFASIGMRTDLHGLSGSVLAFALALVLAAVAAKIVGCGAAARLCGMSGHESLVVGIGMVARGEVALMVAQKGIDAGMIDPAVFPAIVLGVVAAALVTPVLLKLAVNRGPDLA